MSQTFYLICDDCKVFQWVGEEINEHGDSPNPGLLLYREEDGCPAAEFLYAHSGHRIRCMGDAFDAPDDYTKLDAD